jgi:hypothetical protein
LWNWVHAKARTGEPTRKSKEHRQGVRPAGEASKEYAREDANARMEIITLDRAIFSIRGFASSRAIIFSGWLRQPTPARRPCIRVDSPVRAFV